MWFVNWFHIQVLVIELLFCLRLQRRSHFLWRFVPCAAVYCVLPMVIPGGFFTPLLVQNWFTAGFLVMFLLSGLLIYFCFRMNVRQVIFYCCVAHTLQHMVHCMGRMADILFAPSYTTSQLFKLLLMAAISVTAYWFLRERFRGSETTDVKSSFLLMFASISTFIIYVFSLWTTTVEKETIGEQFFDFFSCLLLMFILLDVFRVRKAEREQLMMERLLRQEQEQHALSRATIEVINRKCHDLRHQIAALRHMSEADKEKSISELESAVLIYDSFPKTGNEDLDIILAEKSLLAEEKHIAIRCIVDGGGLTFMKLEDLYSLMGNALDNAIEATVQEQNESKRIVTLYAAMKGSLFSLHLENPCPKQPLFMDGLPVTTKQDKDYHGYGMRSMRYLCEKYGGALTTTWEDGIFALDALFPMEKD